MIVLHRNFEVLRMCIVDKNRRTSQHVALPVLLNYSSQHRSLLTILVRVAGCFSLVNIWRESYTFLTKILRSWKAHFLHSVATMGFYIPIKITLPLPEPATEINVVVNQAFIVLPKLSNDHIMVQIVSWYSSASCTLEIFGMKL